MKFPKLFKNIKNTNHLLSISSFKIAIAIACASIFIFLSAPIQAKINNLYSVDNNDVAGITSLMSAIVSDDIDGVTFFVKSDENSVNKKNLGGATPLHIACRQSNLEIAKILIANNADVNASDNEGWTPLMRASLKGDFNLVSFLISKGAKVDLLNSINESAIIYAANSDCVACLQEILNKFDLSNLSNFSTLKEQLTNAFLVAKNHDNNEIKKLLEVYLNQVNKVQSDINSKIANSEETKKFQEFDLDDDLQQVKTKQKTTKYSSKKVFKFISSEKKSNSQSPLIKPKTKKPQEQESLMSSQLNLENEIKDKKEVIKSNPEIPQQKQQSDLLIIKSKPKFKFISGSEAKIFKNTNKEDLNLEEQKSQDNITKNIISNNALENNEIDEDGQKPINIDKKEDNQSNQSQEIIEGGIKNNSVYKFVTGKPYTKK